jgi:hypothetical protein
VKDVEEARKVDLRPLLTVGAVVAVAAVLLLWATGAFAAGGSSSNDSTGNAPALIQDNGQAPSRDDCPEGRGGSGGGSGGAGPSDGNGAPPGNSDGSGSPDL